MGEGEAMGEAADLSRVPKGEAYASQFSPWALATMTAVLPATLFLHCRPSWGAGCSNPSGSPQTFPQGVSFMEP